MLTSLHAAPQQIATTGLGYAVSYPSGIVGILLTMGLLRMVFRVSVTGEAAKFTQARIGSHLPIERMSIEIRSLAVNGVTLSELPNHPDLYRHRMRRSAGQHSRLHSGHSCAAGATAGRWTGCRGDHPGAHRHHWAVALEHAPGHHRHAA
jgi:uncharacterized transporter YbjL